MIKTLKVNSYYFHDPAASIQKKRKKTFTSSLNYKRRLLYTYIYIMHIERKSVVENIVGQQNKSRMKSAENEEYESHAGTHPV